MASDEDAEKKERLMAINNGLEEPMEGLRVWFNVPYKKRRNPLRDELAHLRAFAEARDEPLMASHLRDVTLTLKAMGVFGMPVPEDSTLGRKQGR